MRALLLCAAFAASLVVTPAAPAQTLHQEGCGLFVQATPLSTTLSSQTSSLQTDARARLAYRLTRRFDVGLTASADEGRLGGILGYTQRFSESGWGYRATASAHVVFGSNWGWETPEPAARVGVRLFRQFDAMEGVSLFPSIGTSIGAGGSYFFFDEDALGRLTGINLSAGLPMYVSVGENMRLLGRASYSVTVLDDRIKYSLDPDNSIRFSLGVQVRF